MTNEEFEQIKNNCEFVQILSYIDLGLVKADPINFFKGAFSEDKLNRVPVLIGKKPKCKAEEIVKNAFKSFRDSTDNNKYKLHVLGIDENDENIIENYNKSTMESHLFTLLQIMKDQV